MVLASSIAALVAGCASGGGGSSGGGSSGEGSSGGGAQPTIGDFLLCLLNPFACASVLPPALAVASKSTSSSGFGGSGSAHFVSWTAMAAEFASPSYTQTFGAAPYFDSVAFDTQELASYYLQGQSGRVTQTDRAAAKETTNGAIYDRNGKLASTPAFSGRSDGFANLAQGALPGFDVTYSKTPSTQGNVSSPFMPQAAAMELAANPYALGWNYQSFGVWDQHNASSASYVISRSYGAATPASSVPSAGNATFSGKLGGLYVSATGQGSIASADLSVNANFSARSLNFASAGTTTTQDFKTSTAAPHLNLSGTLTYSPGSNAFSGTLTNAAGTMSGPSKGQFYGPAAQEIGGVFAVKSATTVETFTGGFGGKR
jgi:hypothetical protein